MVVKQGALSDGLGTRVWRAAHCLCWCAPQLDKQGGARHWTGSLWARSSSSCCSVLCLSTNLGAESGPDSGPRVLPVSTSRQKEALLQGALPWRADRARGACEGPPGFRAPLQRPFLRSGMVPSSAGTWLSARSL